MHHRLVLAVAASLSALCAAGRGWAQAGPAVADQAVPPASTAAPAEQGNIQDIVVTASRREERLRDVPAAVTVITGDTLANIGANGFSDYVSLVPGLGQQDFGKPGQGTIILRGLFTGGVQTTNTTATYIDDAAFSSSGFSSFGSFITPDLDIADLDRIEVLKGPQGTLYGANSLGGIFRIVTKRPDLNGESGSATIEGSAVDGGGLGGLARAAVNVPVIPGELAVRATGVYRLDPGWVENVATGKRDVNESLIRGGRIAARYVPDDALTVDVSAIYQNITSAAAAFQDNLFGTLTPVYGRNKYAQGLNLGGSSTYQLYSGTANYDLGPVTLIGTASYGDYHVVRTLDGLPYLQLARASPVLAEIIPSTANSFEHAAPKLQKFTTEIRAVSKRFGPVEFVTGFFYTDEKNDYNAGVLVKDASGRLLPYPFARLIETNAISNYDEVAGFGDLTFYITDDVDVTGGVRYAYNSQYSRIETPSLFYVPQPNVTARFSDGVANYLANVRWRPTPDISVYARAASGYRPGGPQTNPSAPPGVPTRIQSDSVWTYETGVKGSAFDGKLAFDASVYHTEWTRIQLDSLLGGLVLETNGGNAQVNGVEASVIARPTPLLNLSANLGYTDTRVTEIASGVSAYTGTQVGNGLPLTPKWTTSAQVDRSVPINDDVVGDLGATFRYRSSMPSNFPGATLNPNVRIPSLMTLDLRAAVMWGRYTVQFRAQNVTDALGYATVFTNNLYARQPVPTTATVIRPRTFTLGVTAAF